jgi:hypothetical protein
MAVLRSVNPFFSKSMALPLLAQLTLISILAVYASASHSASGYAKVERSYSVTPNAPASQSKSEMDAKSAGCTTCHTESDSKTMHSNPGVKLGCTDCHGGNTAVIKPERSEQGSEPYLAAMSEAHVLPLMPDKWKTPSSRNPERTYTLLNHESPEFIRFINPSDYRIVDDACGACHQETIQASTHSLHATGAMLWGGATYNNGILPYKNYILGESYGRDGKGTVLRGPKIPDELKQAAADKGVIEAFYPLPAWETVKPGDIFRVFERGGRNITNLFPETGLPSNLGLIQRMEEPGRPDFKQSNRGPGTGGRISVPVINITKTRLNDPLTWFIGTNDQPGDYRNSGCASCHVVYANDRDPRHSGPYAKFGHDGTSITKDTTIDKTESGHPLEHVFTRAIPTSQCMICHMHQPNMFMNSFLGYTMWDYESDAPHMWPEKQQYPSHEEQRKVLDRNPEGAAPRGKWADVDFLKKVWDNNDKMNDTQFADYHGHGWNFRAVFKRDRKGNLLDAEGDTVADDDPEKFDKAVHMSSVHVDVGMHCVDCHFGQDNHGNGHMYGEVALAVEIDCKDCHGTSKEYPNLYTSGPAALEGGADLSLLRTPDGRLRFEWIEGELFQRSSLYPDKEWQMSLVKDSVTEGHNGYNEKAARAKLMSKDTKTQSWGNEVPADELAHSYDEMECYSCHTSWTTSCGGCHLPIEANAKTERHHYEGGESRNYATYNPQVARDQIFMLGRRGPAKGGKIAPTRSTSALVLSSTNSNREKIYIQQPPISASGYSSQAFNPHFAHTVRKTETKTCSDCHVSKKNDNNAIMAQLLMQGTNFINFVGYNTWLGGAGEINAVQVTEWQEPQAVIGSYLHRYAYPDFFQQHLDKGKILDEVHQHSAGVANCLQLRGEYLYVAEGSEGVQVYDVAGIGNKGISQRIITAPYSALGHDAHIDSKNATCIALPSNQPINPLLNQGELMRVANLEQPFHPIYNYAVITDAEEGLILVDINTFADGEPRNNFINRAVTWNEGNLLKGAKHVTIGGHYLYITADKGVVIVDVDNPLEPKLVTVVPMQGAQATAIQFRYLLVTDAEGLKSIDITNVAQAKLVPNNTIAMNNAYKMHLARTFAYVAAGDEGLVIVDITQPDAMVEYQRFNADGALKDSRDIVVATTNASLIGYVADGTGGLKVLQLTSPESQPKFYGFSPDPKPQLIAQYQTDKPALSLSRPLERDRGVDETGGQISVFGRRGSRPLNKTEMEKMYLNKNGELWFVED